jgi:hypothetical protein
MVRYRSGPCLADERWFGSGRGVVYSGLQWLNVFGACRSRTIGQGIMGSKVISMRIVKSRHGQIHI